VSDNVEKRFETEKKNIYIYPENKAEWPHVKCDVWLQMRDMFQRVL